MVIIIRFSYQAFWAWWEKTHPAPEPEPTVAFGKLPKLVFPDNQSEQLNLTIQLPTSQYPEFPDRADVYVMPYKRNSFLAWDEAKEEAAKMGFTKDPEALTADIYRWTKQSPVTSTLELNIIDGSYQFSYNWQEDQSILESKNVPGEQQAISETKSFISRATTLNQDLTSSRNKVQYLKVAGVKLLPAVSFSEAEFVQVDLFRANIDNYPVMTPDPDIGIVSALLSPAQDRRFLKVNYNYFTVNYNLSATYPIKTPQEAWNDLKSGRGYVAKSPENIKDITARRVYLGFYDTQEPQSYLQPIYIFTDNEEPDGNNDFIGYVPAITDSWYQ